MQHLHILKKYTQITETETTNARTTRWPAFATQADADIFTDNQIKAQTIGTYIHRSLTEAAKNRLKVDSDFFMVTSDGSPYFDGPAYFYKVATLVDPDNLHLVENVREKIRGFHVKDFGYSVSTMLSEFKNQMKRLTELGGTYSEDEKFLDFWRMVGTMKEKKFHLFLDHEKSKYRGKDQSRSRYNRILHKENEYPGNCYET